MADHHADTADTTAAAWWEDRYASGATRWSGNANDLLVREVEGLAPGRALELGCGTGGDAIWLAAQGWQVVGVDIAQAALDQAAVHAAEAGVDGAVTWERHDVEESFPAGEFDLVSACYLQSPKPFARLAALQAAAGAVAPGGSLVIVAHERFPSGNAPHPGNYMPSTAELLADLALPEDGWSVETAESVERSRTKDDGELVEYADHVLRFTRR
ncbi:MAG: class I SAM-dependent methyltransferase [Solirubrobacteraceae bacterium]|nr:class I SAM-dependent methyltransferase [Patulibacter sp.]